MSRNKAGNENNSGERLTVPATIVSIIIALAVGVASGNIALGLTTMPKQIEDLEKQNQGQSETISDLNDRISELQSQLDSAKTDTGTSKDEDIQKKIDDLSQQISSVQEENDSLKEQNSTLIEKNKELEKRIEELLGNEEPSNPSEPKGNNEINDNKYALLSVCSPYEKKNYDAPQTITIMGIDYQKGFWLSDDFTPAYAFFNLNGSYNQFDFKIGHVDGSEMHDRTLLIYLDDELQTVDLQADMKLQDYSITVTGVQQMKLEIEDGLGAPKYGVVEAFLQ